MSELRDWTAPPLSAEDERLLESYVHSGRSLDDLPYTQEFEAICRDLNVAAADMAGKHAVFRRLLTLRKQGRLPRAMEFTP